MRDVKLLNNHHQSCPRQTLNLGPVSIHIFHHLDLRGSQLFAIHADNIQISVVHDLLHSHDSLVRELFVLEY